MAVVDDVAGRVEPPAADGCSPAPEPQTRGLERPSGLRPTMRHMMILVAGLAVIFSIDDALVRNYRAAGTIGAVFATIIVGPWILAVLVLAFDRHSPIKHWAAPLIALLFCPLYALYHDGTVLANWLHDGSRPSLAFTAILNSVFVVCFGYYVYAMRPRPCPGCERLALIPLMRIWGRDPRTRNVSWCATCGGRYWKDRQGRWRPDRRTGW